MVVAWLRINPRTLRRRLYQRALEFFIHREAAQAYKDARDLVTAQVMQGRAWVAVSGRSFDDRTMKWWIQVRPYGLNYWYGSSNLCVFCVRAGETDRA